jgi:glycosyltransferase involved in cell wall biosynthesis
MNNVRILHVVNIYFVLPYFIGEQFKYFNSKGLIQHVICSPSEHLESYSTEMGFRYLETKIERSFNPISDIISTIKIINYIKKNKINIVVGHTPKGALLAMIAAFITRVPKRIYFRHGLVFETMTGLMKWLMINLDRITAFCSNRVVCVSPSIFTESQKYKLNSIDKQLILGKGTCGGIDAMNKFNPELINNVKKSELKKKFNLTDDHFVIGFCGRLVKDKGIIELVESFLLTKQKYEKIKLMLVGDFEDRDRLPENVQKKIKNHPDIIITGFIYSDIEYFYSLMNLFVLPSYREGFPTSVLEASAMKLPILTTKVTGCIDSIIPNVTGLFISHSPRDISSKILDIIYSAENSFLGFNGRRHVLENFDYRVIWPIIESELFHLDN